jgi:hypothetical protein
MRFFLIFLSELYCHAQTLSFIFIFQIEIVVDNQLFISKIFPLFTVLLQLGLKNLFQGKFFFCQIAEKEKTLLY